MNSEFLETLGTQIDDAFFIIGAAILVIELLKGLFSPKFRWRGFGDAIASISTQIPYLAVEIFILSFAYLGYGWLAANYAPPPMDLTITTLALVLLAADFIYYWEHRFAHMIRILWTQHAVHHSSRYFNISVAVRFGPFEGIMSAIAHIPLLFLGFSPEMIIFGIIVVLGYQTWIHTELIGKLGVLDAIFNTPSNHRVHHGCDDKYLDKNYGGILIIWDRIFGSYQREEETPNYGLKRDFDSINPLNVWFSEWPGLFSDLGRAKNPYEAWMFIFARPGWLPKRLRD